MIHQQTVEKLRALHLTAMADALAAQASQPDVQALSFEERLGLLVDQEYTYRDNRRLARHLKEAKLRMPACIEDIDYRHPRAWTGLWCGASPRATGSAPTRTS